MKTNFFSPGYPCIQAGVIWWLNKRSLLTSSQAPSKIEFHWRKIGKNCHLETYRLSGPVSRTDATAAMNDIPPRCPRAARFGKLLLRSAEPFPDMRMPRRTAGALRERNREFCGKWSEWQDLNLRPPRPERGALPGCATLRDQTARVYNAGLSFPQVRSDDSASVFSAIVSIAVRAVEPARGLGRNPPLYTGGRGTYGIIPFKRDSSRPLG